MPNGTSDIIERTTEKKTKAPRSPHAVTVIHACRDHQRCPANPGLGFMDHLYANRFSHRIIRTVQPLATFRMRRPRSGSSSSANLLARLTRSTGCRSQ
jgi:hypothetical protein